MIKMLDNYVNIVQNVVTIAALLLIVVAISCAIDAHGKTWTIDDGHFKSIYDDKEECIMSNLGVGRAEICDDETQVMFRNEKK